MCSDPFWNALYINTRCSVLYCDQSKHLNIHVWRWTAGAEGDDCIISRQQGQGLPGFYGNTGAGPAVMLCRKKRWNRYITYVLLVMIEREITRQKEREGQHYLSAAACVHFQTYKLSCLYPGAIEKKHSVSIPAAHLISADSEWERPLSSWRYTSKTQQQENCFTAHAQFFYYDSLCNDQEHCRVVKSDLKIWHQQ